MKEILGENFVFHSKAQITNKNKSKSSKVYDNVLIIKDDDFDKFLSTINGEEEEIEEIKFKLKEKTGKGTKKYYSYKIKLDKKTKKLEGQLIENKTSVEIIPFDSPYSIVPKTSKMKTKTTFTNYVDEDDLSTYGALSSINQFINETSPNISKVLNIVNNKYSNYTKSADISKILDFRKIQNMLGDGFCGYYAIISQRDSDDYGGDTLAPNSKNQEAKNNALKVNDLKQNVVTPYLKDFKVY
jgi:hypothetical protein